MTDPTVIAAIITAITSLCLGGLTFIGGIIVAIIGRVPVENFFSRRERQRQNIPEIMKTKWETEWYFEDKSLYVKDIVTFSNWKKGNQFEGYGEVTHEGKLYKYSLEGEVSPNRIVVFTYKAEKFPSQANIGTACVDLSSSAEELEGIWAGRVTKTLPDGQHVHLIRSGAVKMRRIKKL